MTTPQHCPGFETFKDLTSFTCNCPNCGKEIEVFSDEFNRKHICQGCKQEVDFSKCTMKAGGATIRP
jgi:hypothetical protein